ncbi:hypothetical protein NHJ13734_009166 [Beauveria thailandica]
MHFTQLICAAALVSCTTAAVAEAAGQSPRSALRIYARRDIFLQNPRLKDFMQLLLCRNELVADVEEDEPDLREIGAHDNLDSVKCREK